MLKRSWLWGIRLVDRELTTIDPARPTADNRLPAGNSFILILPLWTLITLSILACSLSRSSFVEAAVAQNAQSSENPCSIARAGIEDVINRLIQKRRSPPVPPSAVQDMPDALDLGRITGSVGSGVYQVDIQDESGKVNLNAVSEKQLRTLVAALGISEPDAGIITDAILDWRDADNISRLNGAEDDYYQALNPPYKAKNGWIETLDELLRIRGITADYFYGRAERDPSGSVVHKYGLSPCVTVYSTRIQININFAPLPVLMSIPGMPAQAAQMIFDRRHVKPFRNLEEVTREVPVPLGAATLPYLDTVPTGIYMLTASAHAENLKSRCIIRTIVSLQPSNGAQYKTLYWNETIPDTEGILP